MARGRGAAARPKEVTMWMPGITAPPAVPPPPAARAAVSDVPPPPAARPAVSEVRPSPAAPLRVVAGPPGAPS
jgi:hypothetical protein